ncbi:MAG TPA: MOSC domain-containing protein [Bacteroidetes bacterium]|nr:MOSC domain-containing protein [Bacteroidota bacterium]
MSAIVYRLSISAQKGQRKTNVPSAQLDKKLGIIGDAHGTTERQVSLLPLESFSKLEHPDLVISPGDFAENITTEGLDFDLLKMGTVIRLGDDARLQVIQIGKECHEDCIIRQKVGDCIMPREGVFARVITPGEIQVGDPIEIEKSEG